MATTFERHQESAVVLCSPEGHRLEADSPQDAARLAVWLRDARGKATTAKAVGMRHRLIHVMGMSPPFRVDGARPSVTLRSLARMIRTG